MPSLYDELRAIAAEETSRAVGFRVKGDDFGVGPVVSRIVEKLYEPTEAMVSAGTAASGTGDVKDMWFAMLGAIKEETR